LARPVLVVTLLWLSACANTYGPPPNGKPQTWGQQHYLDVQRYRETIENGMSN
jgi:hypothetical protein